MKKLILGLSMLTSTIFTVHAQEGKIKFEEYDLPNGLHVILHQDHSTPIVNVSVMYHVGSKNEDPQRTGFAHFFEHLMFEGTDNIKRGEYMKIVQAHGGVLNANTTQDRTYYFQTLPSNETQLALWLESERMLHAKIDSTGIETQRKVVKEEKKQRFDNQPYGHFIEQIFANAYTLYPYKWSTIGSDQYIDKASYDEFRDFYHTFYVPNNATLVVVGDINIEETKSWINKYFSTIPKGTKAIPRPEATEPPIGKEKVATYYDNIQLPLLAFAYHAPKLGSPDYYALSMLNQLLSQGASSRFTKNIVNDQKKAVAAGSFTYPLEDDPGLIIVYGIANMGINVDTLKAAMDLEINKVMNGDITEKEFQKLQNQVESNLADENAKIATLAENLATDYTYYHNTNLVNNEWANYKKVTLADLKNVAKKYYTPNSRVVLYYLPNSMKK